MGIDENKLRVLRENGHYLSVPNGVSMWPMLKDRTCIADIVPLNRPLKKYDVALYERESSGQYVLHRILAVKQDRYIFYGDNCWQKESVAKDKVVGVAEQFYRDGAWVSVDNWKYRCYVHLWCDFLPLRRLIFRVRDKVKTQRKKGKQHHEGK